MAIEISRVFEAARQRARKSRHAGSLWPPQYSIDSAEAAWEFCKLCKTWDEASAQTRSMPQDEHLYSIVKEWHETRASGQPLGFEKSRRMVVSWLLCVLDVWDAGLRRCNIIEAGADYQKASDFVWRCYFIYRGLQDDFPSWKLPDPETWGNPSSQHLEKMALPNQSLIESMNADSESFRGTGKTRVKLEELSSYRYVSKVLAQALIVTQGMPGQPRGHVVFVSNAAVNEEWKEVKSAPQEMQPLPSPQEVPYLAYTTRGGNRIIRLHYCVAEGSLVSTLRGPVPIQDIAAGDMALTSTGTYRLVEWAGRTKVDAICVRVTASSGHSVIVTPNHEIRADGSWVRAKDLKYGMILDVCQADQLNSTAALSSGNTGTAGTGWAITPRCRRAPSTCTDSCGKQRSGRYQKATKSTILTKTKATTSYLTWNASQRKITSIDTKTILSDLLLGQQSHSLRRRPQRQSGVGQKRVRRLGGSRDGDSPLISSLIRMKSCAADVGRDMCPAEPLAHTSAQNAGTRNQRCAPASVIGVSIAPKGFNCYDLTVQGNHEFYANGILVHNSASSDKDEEWVALASQGIPKTEWLREYELYDAEVDDALWTQKMIEDTRVFELPKNVVQVLISIDPSVADPAQAKNPSRKPDEVGILVGAVTDDFHVYIIDDLSGDFSPLEWAREAVTAYSKYKANRIIAEDNQGGSMVKITINQVSPMAPVQLVHAKIGKRARAEPVALAYELGFVHHLGFMKGLENEQVTWSKNSTKSPGRIDALSQLVTASGILESLTGEVADRFSSKTSEPTDYIPEGALFNPKDLEEQETRQDPNPFASMGWD